MTELYRTTDLALHAIKKTVAAVIVYAMAAMVATERHLLINLADIREKEKQFLLDAPVSSSELIGTSIEMVVSKFREVRAWFAAC